MKRLLLGAFAGAIVLMIWGFLYWTVNPWAKSMLRPIDNEDRVIEALSNAIPETGVYFMPLEGMHSKATQESFLEKHRSGPLIRVIFTKEGADPMAPAVYIMGFIHFFLSALLSCSRNGSNSS